MLIIIVTLRVVSRHELFPIRAPLYTLEHCISPFLDSCDPDDDHNITLKEWGKCLQLDAVGLKHKLKMILLIYKDLVRGILRQQIIAKVNYHCEQAIALCVVGERCPIQTWDSLGDF